MSTASAYLTVRGIDVDVVYKDIKNLHIGVYPPLGRVRVAAPSRLDDEQVRLAVIQRLPWIKRQRKQLQDASASIRARDGHRRVALRLGRPPPPHVIERPGRPTSKWTASDCCCTCRRARTARPAREAAGAMASRTTASAQSPPDQQLGADDRPTVPRWSIRRMKTKWGSCNRETGHIWFNLELAKKHPRLPGVHRRPRDDAPPRARPRRTLHGAHGRLHARLACTTRRAQRRAAGR